MSLTSLANTEMLRKERGSLRVRHRPKVIQFVNDSIALKHNLAPNSVSDLADDIVDLTTTQVAEDAKASNVLDSLVKYIPTESVTLYIAAVSAMSALQLTFPPITPVIVYWFFVVLTPILFLLIYVGKRRNVELPPFPAGIKNWPWWKLAASTIAFSVWALAIPAAPYLTGNAGNVVAALLALFVSTLLSLLQPVFERAT
jgi:hypothetical protein